ncbi:MAG TPA: hypothetical protein VN958_15195, partial [Chitinophagaceae bacterium]|nr:hypothetical protein [Chitinophagaceae bacterium]
MKKKPLIMSVKLTLKLALMMALLYAGQTLFAQDSTKTQLTDSLSKKTIASPLDTVKPAPKPEEKKNTLTISVDMRTRTEIRHGYRVIPKEDTSAAF